MKEPGAAERSGFLHAAWWSYVMEGGQQGLSLIVTFTLAALLGPEVFGLAAMATVYVAFVDLLQRQGMAAALIQRKELTASHKDTGFWLVMGISVLMTAVSVAGAGFWAQVNNTPDLQAVIVALSPLVLLRGLTTVHDALLRRDMQFKALAKRTISAVVLGGVAGLGGAALGWGIYALVAQQLVFGAVSMVVLWSISDWRPRIRFSLQSGRDLLGFSTGSFLTSIAVFVNNRADEILIGLFFGPAVVGIYRLGSRLIDVVLTGVVGPIESLALPELSPHQDDPPELTRRAERLLRMCAVAALPLLGVLAASAGPLIEILGPQWVGAAPVIQILCVVGVVRVITTLDGPLLQAVGSPFVQAGITGIAATVSAVTFSGAGVLLSGAAVNTQAFGMAAARAGVYGTLILAIHVLVLRRYAGLGWTGGLTPFAKPALVGLLACASGMGALAIVPRGVPLLGLLAAATTAVIVGVSATWRWVPECSALVLGALARRRPTSKAVAADAAL